LLPQLLSTFAYTMATTEYDQKAVTDRISDDIVQTAGVGHESMHGKLAPPPLVAAMSQEQRIQAEAEMRRKIDMRLLPMIILMYIMNYLDRNNIAAVRLAGLQDELNLTSVQYQVKLATTTYMIRV
jgi:hypothetical protein